jgi:hypothetical protein
MLLGGGGKFNGDYDISRVGKGKVLCGSGFCVFSGIKEDCLIWTLLFLSSL